MGVLLKRLVKEQPLGTLGGCVVLALIVVSIFAGALAPYEPDDLHLVDRFQGPSARYLLGTDQLGRDLLSRLIYGARISVFVGLAGTTVHVVVAALIGGTAGFFGGKLDLAVQRIIDAWMSFPGLLLLLTIMSIAGQGLAQIIIVLGVSAGITNSRVVRSAVIGIKGNDYFAARQRERRRAVVVERHREPLQPGKALVDDRRRGTQRLRGDQAGQIGHGGAGEDINVREPASLPAHRRGPDQFSGAIVRAVNKCRKEPQSWGSGSRRMSYPSPT